MKRFLRLLALFLALALASLAISACSSGPRVINIGGSGSGVVIYD